MEEMQNIKNWRKEKDQIKYKELIYLMNTRFKKKQRRIYWKGDRRRINLYKIKYMKEKNILEFRKIPSGFIYVYPFNTVIKNQK